jgi:predicted Zn-dependent protease
MWDVDSLALFFEQAHALGYSHCELYAEQADIVTSAFLGATDQWSASSRNGIAFTALKDQKSVRFFHHGKDLSLLLCTLQGVKPREAEGTQKTAQSPCPQNLFETTMQLLQVARSAFASSNERLQSPQLQSTVMHRKYWVARESGPVHCGEEQSAEVVSDWIVKSETPSLHQWECARSSWLSLVEEIQSPDGLVACVKRSLKETVLWPAPNGEMAVLWSASSVAVLHALFLKAFDGERVLSERSFLNALSLPLALTYSIEDSPSAYQPRVDHEGVPTRPTAIFKEGRPTVLSCTNETALALEVAPTGHAYRSSFKARPKSRFWNPKVLGSKTVDAVLPLIERGISVREVETVSYNARSGDVVLKLKRCHLIHQGAEGEAVEPVVLHTSLIALLESLTLFETSSKTTGVAFGHSPGVRFVEVTAPAALSRPLPFPGTVPADHYW